MSQEPEIPNTFASRMTSTTSAVVAAGSVLVGTAYRDQRVVTAFNYFEGTLSAFTGEPLPNTSTLAVATNDRHGVGAWNIQRIRAPVVAAPSTRSITGFADIASTNWMQPITSGIMPVSIMGLIVEGFAQRTVGNNQLGPRNNVLYQTRSNNSGTTWSIPEEVPPMTFGAGLVSPSRPTIAIDESLGGSRRTVIAFIGNRGSAGALIGVSESRTDDAVWTFAHSQPGVVGMVAAVNVGPNEVLAVKDVQVRAGMERVLLRANSSIGTYLAVDVQVPRPGDVDVVGDGYCFPLLYRYEPSRDRAALEFVALNAFNSQMLNWTGQFGGFRCHRKIDVGNATLPTSHVDFAVDQVWGALVAAPRVGQVRFAPALAERAHVVFTAIPHVPPSSEDEVIYHNFLVTRDAALGGIRRESFAGGTALSHASQDGERAFQPTVSATGGSVFVTWYQQNLNQQSPDYQRVRMLARRSRDGGLNFGPIREINSLSGQPVSEAICPTTGTAENAAPYWSRYSGSVALIEFDFRQPTIPTPPFASPFAISDLDPFAVTAFTGGQYGECRAQSASSALFQEVHIAHWR